MKPLLSLPGLHYAARRFGWPSLKRAAFDAKFKAGHWGNPHESKTVVSCVESYTQGGSLAVLGCGVNSLGRQLRPEAYYQLVGLDLSPAALEGARESALERQYFVLGDMATWQSTSLFDVVVFHESINYIEPKNLIAVLDHWKNQMRPSGIFIVTVSEPERYAELLDIICDQRAIISDELVDGSKRRMIVFQ